MADREESTPTYTQEGNYSAAQTQTFKERRNATALNPRPESPNEDWDRRKPTQLEQMKGGVVAQWQRGAMGAGGESHGRWERSGVER